MQRRRAGEFRALMIYCSYCSDSRSGFNVLVRRAAWCSSCSHASLLAHIDVLSRHARRMTLQTCYRCLSSRITATRRWPPLQKPCRQQGPAGVPLAWPTAAAAHQSSASPKQHQPLFPAKQHQPLNPATAAGGQRPKRSRLWPTPTRPRQTRRP